MPVNHVPYFRQQAGQLLETGRCDLPVTIDDVAHRVARDESFTQALEMAVNNDTRLLKILRVKHAAELCRDFDTENDHV